MFLVLLEYQRPLEIMDRYVAAHRTYLAQQYAEGRLVMSGPQVPRTGGVIIARFKTREEVEAMMRSDPFVTGGVATYQIVEFVARATHPALDAFAEPIPA